MSNQNDNFDFEVFAVEAIRYIDSIRSYQKDGAKTTESRINSFYRALGLPAVVPDDERELPNGRPDDFNNGNVQDLTFRSYKADLDERQGLYDKEIQDDEIADFMDKNAQNIKSGISKTSENRRRRGVLFPMIVDGRIHVFPQSRRIGGAFMSNKELKHGKISYNRPLIETILLVKLKGENIVDSSQQSDTSTAFNSSELKRVNENAEKRLGRTLNTIASFVEETVRSINGLRTDIGANVIPTVENVADQNHKIETSETRVGTFETMQLNQEAHDDLQNTVLSLFEFDDTTGYSTRNLKGDGLASIFIEMLVPTKKVKRNTNLLDRQLAKAKLNLKRAFRNLDLILGTFGAISGVDVLVVLSALYRLEPEYLVGLLNKESQDRLKALKGNIPAVQGAKPLAASISKLETEVTKIFDELTGYIKIVKHDEKIRHQDAEEEK